MPLDLISEEELHLALSPYRVNPGTFEAAVRVRVKESEGREVNPLSDMPLWLQTAASFLPMEVLTAGQVAGATARPVPIVGIVSKLLGYAVFPAFSLFVLLGSTIFGVAKIRKIQGERSSGELSGEMNEQTMDESVKGWRRAHRWGSWLLLAATIALAWIGATWLMFTGYIISTLILLYILKSFARIGIGNRWMVGQSCLTGLVLLGQLAGFAGIGDEDIHVLDQALLVPLFFAGALFVSLASGWGSRRRFWILRNGVFAVVVLLMAGWFMNPILWPATPARINAYVASFDRAEFSSASWKEWEIVASWAVKSNPAPDLSRPRRLLAEVIADPQVETLPQILDSALNVGLVRADQAGQLKDYEMRLRTLFDSPSSSRISLGWDDWVIRVAALRQDLTQGQRDYLAERLHATLRWSLTRNTSRTLNEPLRVTQLLDVIGRPVDPMLYQKDIHELLKKLHSKTGGGFQRAGGFKLYDDGSLRAGDYVATSDAIELMEFYGIPKYLDMTWVRSFLKPSFLSAAPEKWTIAVTRNRLDRLPGIASPSLIEVLYFERSFLAAMILIGLCIYATAISPVPPQTDLRA